MFVRHSSGGKTTVLIIYVDDMILIGNHAEEIQRLKQFLAKEFEIKDLGNINMEVAHSAKGIVVS